jgi:hypothetical protein
MPPYCGTYSYELQKISQYVSCFALAPAFLQYAKKCPALIGRFYFGAREPRKMHVTQRDET